LPDLTAPLPPLRGAIDVIPVHDDGQRYFCLRDRLDAEAPPLVVSEAALLLVSLLDGQRSLAAVQAAFTLRVGVPLPEQQLATFVQRLDDANLLDSEAYRARLEQARACFRAAPLRAAVHAGGAYPGEPAELAGFLDGLFRAEHGPGARPTAVTRACARALIAPHIDLHRGGTAYAWTYTALAECEPADLYVLLGTCHTPMATPLSATRKAYDTPLGAARVDQAFVDALAARCPDLFTDEFSHRSEHSLEFQAVFLRFTEHVGDERGAKVVPLLCGSLQQWVDPASSPRASVEVASALEALGQTLAEWPGRVCLVAGADLAHVGPQFGDRQAVGPAVSEAVRRADLEMLDLVCQGDAEGFYRQVMRDDDARRICGLSPIYYLLSLVGPAAGRLLTYDQWVDPAGQGSVTYAGVIFEQ
jgi:AmmeMemoRadiSam system protein B